MSFESKKPAVAEMSMVSKETLIHKMESEGMFVQIPPAETFPGINPSILEGLPDALRPKVEIVIEAFRDWLANGIIIRDLYGNNHAGRSKLQNRFLEAYPDAFGGLKKRNKLSGNNIGKLFSGINAVDRMYQMQSIDTPFARKLHDFRDAIAELPIVADQGHFNRMSMPEKFDAVGQMDGIARTFLNLVTEDRGEKMKRGAPL